MASTTASTPTQVNPIIRTLKSIALIRESWVGMVGAAIILFWVVVALFAPVLAPFEPNTFVPPGSAGPICITPGLQRFSPPVSNTEDMPGGFSRVVGTTGPTSGLITAGSTWSFQAWHRDGTFPSNLTDAMSVTFR